MMKFTRFDLVLTILCILGLMAAVVNAADMSGTSGPSEKSKVPQAPDPNQQYTISQTLSDQAQKATIAFDALAFLTGDACSDSFLPPGKVADYAGFQYLRDNDPTHMGHNTDFVTRASDNVLYLLNDSQRAEYIALSTQEQSLTERYAYMRFPLMKAFRTLLEGNTTSGGSLDKQSVMDYSAALYGIDADISLQRAKTYASVIRSLNQTQRAYLDKMATGGMLTWPVVDIAGILKSSGKDNSVAMRTYASEMFAWYAGSVEADTYFCPERQATYFGSFYMKDRPAMGNPGYSISTTLTGDSGESFLNLLSDTQREKIAGLVPIQQADLKEIVQTRQAIATELRRSLAGMTIDEDLVRSLSARYGELDGEISYLYATHFADVGKTLTNEQKQKMIALRNLDGYVCEGAYLYSQPITMLQNIPTDFLYGVGSYQDADMTAWIESQQSNTASENLNRDMGQGNARSNQNEAPPSSQGSPPSEQGAGQGQVPRLPVEEVITQVGQMGYDISGITDAMQSGDRETMKSWLDTFTQMNPGVVETIEGAGSKPGKDPGESPKNSPSEKPPKNQA
jgi:hypothetical protein